MDPNDGGTEMKRTLMAASLGLTLAVAPMASLPAQALDRDQVAGLIAGIAILGLAGSALSDGQGGRVTSQVVRRSTPDYRVQRPPVRHTLPARCLRSFERRQRALHVFGQRCLQKSGVNLRHLPRACATEIRVGGRYRTAYEARCLRHNGWRMAQHR